MTSDGMARDYLQRARARRLAVEALFGEADARRAMTVADRLLALYGRLLDTNRQE